MHNVAAIFTCLITISLSLPPSLPLSLPLPLPHTHRCKNNDILLNSEKSYTNAVNSESDERLTNSITIELFRLIDYFDKFDKFEVKRNIMIVDHQTPIDDIDDIYICINVPLDFKCEESLDGIHI